MRKINKFIFLFILGSIFQSTSYAKSSLLPLDEYLINQDIKSYTTKEYVLLRCSANFKYMATLVASAGGEVQPLLEGMSLMVIAAIQARQITNAERQLNQSIDEIQNTMVGIANSLTDKYIEDGKNNWLETGSYFQNTYIDNDRTYCNSIHNNLEVFLLNTE